MRARAAVIGGLFDSGFAALAAFAASVYAARVLETSALGYYSLFLTAFLAASTIPGRLLFFPFEVAAVAKGPTGYFSSVRRAVRKGAPLSMTAAAASAAVAGLLAREAGAAAVVSFGASMAAAAALSPLQDHVRRILHVGGRSGYAAAVSIVQLVGVLGSIFLLDSSGVDPLWIPYSSLAVANALSLTLGLVLVGYAQEGPDEDPPPFRSVARSGSWLLYISLLGPVVGMAVNALVIELTSAETLGFAEAARQVARPLLVITTGLGMALRPRSFAAAQRRDRPRARRIELIAVSITILAGVAYAAWVSLDWPLNFMEALIPKAYQIEWLVLAVCLSNIVVGVAFPTGYELIGAGKEPVSAAIESIGQVLRLLTATFSATLGAFTIAACDTVLGSTRTVGYRIGVRDIYRQAQDIDEPFVGPAEADL